MAQNCRPITKTTISLSVDRMETPSSEKAQASFAMSHTHAREKRQNNIQQESDSQQNCQTWSKKKPGQTLVSAPAWKGNTTRWSHPQAIWHINAKRGETHAVTGENRKGPQCEHCDGAMLETSIWSWQKVAPKNIRKILDFNILWQAKDQMSCVKTLKTWNCQLCVKERLMILKAQKKDPQLLINANSEFHRACQHIPQFHRHRWLECAPSADDGEWSAEKSFEQ